MAYILSEDWHGMERTSPEWCQKQAEAIKKYIDDDNEYIDVDGVVMLFTEMAELRYSTAESMALRLMEHLLGFDNCHAAYKRQTIKFPF